MTRSPRGLLVVAFGVALAVFSAAANLSAAPRRVVVAVGSNHGLDPEPTLVYAELDAQRFARVMVDLGGVEPNDAHVALDREPERVLDIIRRAGTRLSLESELIVYYSGHGDESNLHLNGRLLSLEQLREAVEGASAGLRLLIIDSCRDLVEESGDANNVTDKGISVSPSPTFDVSAGLQGRLGLRGKHRGVVEMRSAARGGRAAESNRLRAGIFSHHLLSGLRGAADRDADSRVSLDEAYAFAYRRTVYDSRWTRAQPQTPVIDISTLEGVGPLLLTSVYRSDSVLTLPAEAEASYQVFEKGSEVQFAEAFSQPDQVTHIALHAGQFVVHRRHRDEADFAEVTMPFGGSIQLAAHDFQPLPPDEDPDRGGRAGIRINQVAITLGMLVDDAGRLGRAGTMRYARGSMGWRPSIGLAVTQREFQTSHYQTSRDSYTLSVGAEYEMSWGTIDPGFSLGLSASLIDQDLAQRGSSEPLHQLGFGLGPFARAGMALPLTTGVAWYVDLFTSALVFRGDREPGTESRPMLETSFQIANGLAFGF